MAKRCVCDGARMLRVYMRENGHTFVSLSSRMCVEPNSLFRWANGRVRPSKENAALIEDHTGIPWRSWLKTVCTCDDDNEDE